MGQKSNSQCFFVTYNNMKDFLFVILLLGIFYWYFNIRGKTKCVMIIKECDGIDYVEEN